MPNHIHLIVVFSNAIDGRTRCALTNDLSEPCRDASNASKIKTSDNSTDTHGVSLRFGPQLGNLPSVVRGIKASITKYAIELYIEFAWQSRYHDHIIRNPLEMNRIADYIENNPMRWETDEFYRKR